MGKIRRRRKQRRKKKFWVFLVMYFKNFEKFFEVIITKVVQKTCKRKIWQKNSFVKLVHLPLVKGDLEHFMVIEDANFIAFS